MLVLAVFRGVRRWKKGNKLGHGRWLESRRAQKPGAGPRPCHSVLGAGPHWPPSHQRGSHPRDMWGHSPATSLPGPATSCCCHASGRLCTRGSTPGRPGPPPGRGDSRPPADNHGGLPDFHCGLLGAGLLGLHLPVCFRESRPSCGLTGVARWCGCWCP